MYAVFWPCAHVFVLCGFCNRIARGNGGLYEFLARKHCWRSSSRCKFSCGRVRCNCLCILIYVAGVDLFCVSCLVGSGVVVFFCRINGGVAWCGLGFVCARGRRCCRCCAVFVGFLAVRAGTVDIVFAARGRLGFVVRIVGCSVFGTDLGCQRLCDCSVSRPRESGTWRGIEHFPLHGLLRFIWNSSATPFSSCSPVLPVCAIEQRWFVSRAGGTTQCTQGTRVAHELYEASRETWLTVTARSKLFRIFWPAIWTQLAFRQLVLAQFVCGTSLCHMQV